MPIQLEEICNTLEACYEFTLAYAAQGLPSDVASSTGRQLRAHLADAAAAIGRIDAACTAILAEKEQMDVARYETFFHVLAADAHKALATLELVRVQPTIGSELIDSLNASIHWRALLADLFLVVDVLRQKPVAGSSTQEVELSGL